MPIKKILHQKAHYQNIGSNGFMNNNGSKNSTNYVRAVRAF